MTICFAGLSPPLHSVSGHCEQRAILVSYLLILGLIKKMYIGTAFNMQGAVYYFIQKVATKTLNSKKKYIAATDIKIQLIKNDMKARVRLLLYRQQETSFTRLNL